MRYRLTTYLQLFLGLTTCLVGNAAHVNDRAIYATDIKTAAGTSVFLFPTTAPSAGGVGIYNSNGEASSDANLLWDSTNRNLDLINGNLLVDKSNLKFTYESPPGAPTIALVTTGTGNCTNGAHRVKITFLKADGTETEAGTQSASVTCDASHKQISLTAIPTGTVGIVTARNIYLGINTNSVFARIGAGISINDNTTTTFTVNVADGSTSSNAPNVNTTGGGIYVAGNKSASFDKVSRYFQAAYTSNSAFTSTSGNEVFGFGASISGNHNTVLGAAAVSNGSSSTVIGSGASGGGGSGQVIIGAAISATDNSVVIIGAGATGTTNSTAIGGNALASGGNDVAVGLGARTGNGSVAIGTSALAQGTEAVAIGHGWNLTQSGTVAIGGNGYQVNLPGATIINSVGYVGGGAGVMIGGAVGMGTASVAIGSGSNANQYGIGIGYNAVAAPSCVAIGQDIQTNYANSGAIGTSLTTQSSDQLILGYTDTYFKQVTGDGSLFSVLHSPDAGSADQSGGDFSIQPGISRGTGDGGTFHLKMNTSLNSSGSSQPTPYDAILTTPGGTSTFTGATISIPNPTTPTSATAYQQGATGYVTDGATTRQYTAFAYKTVGLIKIFSTPGLDLGTLGPDDNSTVTFGGNQPTLPSATETGAGAGYNNGDTIEYEIFAQCEVNGSGLYSGFSNQVNVTITNPTSDVAVGWTVTAFPAGCINNRVRILRQVNGAGFNDYFDVADPGNSLNDDGTGWTGGGLSGSTTVQNYYQNNLTWVTAGSPDGYLIYRVTNGGAPDATDAGLVTSFTDTGGLAWAASTTNTPTSIAGQTIQLAYPDSPIHLPAGYPTSATGLASGSVWVDTASGYVLKVVP